MSRVIPRTFNAAPSSADMIDGDFVVGDRVVANGQERLYQGSGVWMNSQNDIVPPGTIYYVKSIGGSNTNSGLSWNTALATITAAVALAVSGDTIYIQGSFNEAVTCSLDKFSLWRPCVASAKRAFTPFLGSVRRSTTSAHLPYISV